MKVVQAAQGFNKCQNLLKKQSKTTMRCPWDLLSLSLYRIQYGVLHIIFLSACFSCEDEIQTCVPRKHISDKNAKEWFHLMPFWLLIPCLRIQYDDKINWCCTLPRYILHCKRLFWWILLVVSVIGWRRWRMFGLFKYHGPRWPLVLQQLVPCLLFHDWPFSLNTMDQNDPWSCNN